MEQQDNIYLFIPDSWMRQNVTVTVQQRSWWHESGIITFYEKQIQGLIIQQFPMHVIKYLSYKTVWSMSEQNACLKTVWGISNIISQ